MNMEKIFSTEERIRILTEVIFRTGPVSVSDVAARLKLSKGLVSKYFDILAKEGILRKSKGKLFATDSSMVKAVKILLNIRNINAGLFRKYPFVKSVGLYGSCAKGENTEDSDIDIWIRIQEAKEEVLASLTSALQRKVSKGKVVFLTDRKIEKLKKEDELFYHALAFGSIILYGDKNGVQV